jgi:hypothetical protein
LAVLTGDVPVVEDLLGQAGESYEEWGLCHLTWEQANLGFYNELDQVYAAGVVFEGQHDGGRQYGPAAFACDGTDYVHVDADREGTPMARVHDDGPDHHDLKRIAEYWRVYANARALLEEPRAIRGLREAVGK